MMTGPNHTRKVIGSKLEKSIHADGGAWLRGPLLGNGTYGAVHLAYFPKASDNSGRFKGFPLVAAVKSTAVSCSEELETEKSLYESLGESPFVLRYLGEDTTVDPKTGRLRLNLFLEYASGGSLYEFVRKTSGFGLLESQARRYTRSILQGIKLVHEAGFTHCDLKPDNVMLVRDTTKGSSVPKIGDFGSAKRADNEALTGGTLLYLSPESRNRGIQGQASDIWALGCIVFSMLTGKLEWEIAPEIREMAEPSGKISQEAQDFVAKCLSSDPSDRPTAVTLLSHPFLSESGQARREDDEREEISTILSRRLREGQCWCL